MDEVEAQPLLSICIPTYNRAHLLKVMLEALLPQVRECGSAVEVWVLDNGSGDTTASVIEDARKLGPLKVHRHPQNVGPLRNIIHGPLNLATAKFCWVLGDHNLLRPGGLARVIEHLRTNPAIDAFYINFRTATWPDHWPESAFSGYDGDYDIVANPESEHGIKPFWHELLRCETSAGTQSYAHIIRSRHWKTYWKDRSIGCDYTSAETTYPHTVTVAAYCFDRPAFFIGTPALTIFNGAQSWSNPNIRLRVYFLGFCDLLRMFLRLGLSTSKARDLFYNFLVPNSRSVIRDATGELGIPGTFRLFVNTAGFRWQAWALLASCLKQELSAFSLNYRHWYLYNFLPARWVRGRLSKQPSARPKNNSVPLQDGR
jgi:glycosyltransferase involved in cell wall biosynthesis